jgi:hypothetical protein
MQALCDQFRWHYNHQRPHQGIGQHWKGQRVAVIETKPDYVVVLDRTTGAVIRELILGSAGAYPGHYSWVERRRDQNDRSIVNKPTLRIRSQQP